MPWRQRSAVASTKLAGESCCEEDTLREPLLEGVAGMSHQEESASVSGKRVVSPSDVGDTNAAGFSGHLVPTFMPAELRRSVESAPSISRCVWHAPPLGSSVALPPRCHSLGSKDALPARCQSLGARHALPPTRRSLGTRDALPLRCQSSFEQRTVSFCCCVG